MQMKEKAKGLKKPVLAHAGAKLLVPASPPDHTETPQMCQFYSRTDKLNYLLFTAFI